MSDNPLDASRLTRIYRKIRDKKEEASAAFKKQDDLYKDQLDQVGKLMLDLMEATGSDGLKTEFGTVSKVVKQRFWSTDWDDFKTFVKENDALDLFEQRVAQKNMAEWIAKHPDKLPLSLQIDRRYSVLVVKPRIKAE